MSKLKTHSGTKKRVKKTGSGKFKHKQSHTRHILTKKNSKRKRQLRGLKQVESCHTKTLKKLLGAH